jgi:hypothetical protein
MPKRNTQSDLQAIREFHKKNPGGDFLRSTAGSFMPSGRYKRLLAQIKAEEAVSRFLRRHRLSHGPILWLWRMFRLAEPGIKVDPTRFRALLLTVCPGSRVVSGYFYAE